MADSPSSFSTGSVLVDYQTLANIDWDQLLKESQRTHQINKNYDEAMTLIPESFVKTQMLYVDVHIKGLHFKAFIDTGAQFSIMSEFIAEACDLRDLIDPAYQGLAQGVGETPILGRVHCLDVCLGTKVIPCSFRVLKSMNIKLILGLDMLLSHGCLLDLKNRCLILANETIEFVAPDE